MPSWERGDADKAKMFLLLSLMCLNLCIFTPTPYWNFSARNLDFHKDSLICGWLSKTVFLETYRLQPRRVRARNRPLQGPQPAPKSLCRLPNTQWTKLLPGPLIYDTRSHSSHKGTFVHEWMPNYYCWGGVRGMGTQMRNLLLSHVAEATENPNVEVPPQGHKEVRNKYSLPKIKTKHCWFQS